MSLMYPVGHNAFMRYAFILIIVMLAFSERLTAQKNSKAKHNTHRQAVHRLKKRFDKERYTTLGLSVSVLQYFGDLAPKSNGFSTDLLSTRPGVELSVGHKYSPYLKVQARLLIGEISGTDSRAKDSYRYYRNASFKNRITEFSVINIFEPANHGFYIHRQRFGYYGFIGVGIFHHNPKGKVPDSDLEGKPFKNAGDWIALRPLGTEGQFSKLAQTDVNYGNEPYSLFQPSIPFGFGIRHSLNASFDFSVEMGFRILFTDYIDDVSKNYVDLGLLETPLAKAMSYRTNEISEEFEVKSYVGRDGVTYNVKPGYGSEHLGNKRGGSGENDFFTVINFRLCYIIEDNLHKAKGR